ncbi:MAG: response regulator [Pseudomonadota bacterium]|nr:response regulator [Pseudomonadota bacterium]
MSIALPPILVVDDEPDDLFFFQRAAAAANLANPIDTAEDGDAAIAWLSACAAGEAGHRVPIAVILDLKMPRRSGFEVLAWIRKNEGLRRMPVVIYTSSGLDPDVARAYDLGANSYLVKPVTFDALVALIRTLGLYWGVLNMRPPPCVPAAVG